MILSKIKRLSKNSKVVAKNAAFAFIIKGAAFVISFFSTPAFIRYFNNNEVLGLWFTLLSVLMWFLTFDLGIGNGIRNHLVKAVTDNDWEDARKILSSGIAWTAVITIIFAFIGFILLSSLNLNSLLNIDYNIIKPSVLKKTTYLVFGAVILRFFLTTVHSIFYALQKSSINNLLSFIVSLFLFVYVLTFHFENVEDSLINIALAYLLISNIPTIIAGIIVFSRELRNCRPSISYITSNATKRILGIGFIFFFCQVSFLIITGTNEFFISHFWNPFFTAEYSFYYRITMLISTIVSLALTPTWSMITKAHQEGDILWVKKLYKLFKITGVIVLILQFLLIPFLQAIMNLWLGANQLEVRISFAIAFACFGSVMLYSTMLSTIVCGLGTMKLQAVCFGIGSLLKIILVIILAKMKYQWIGIIVINTIILGVYCMLEQLKLNSLFSLKK